MLWLSQLRSAGVGGVRSTQTNLRHRDSAKKVFSFYWAAFKFTFNRPCVFSISNSDYGFCVGQECGVGIKCGDLFFSCEDCFALATLEATFNTRR